MPDLAVELANCTSGRELADRVSVPTLQPPLSWDASTSVPLLAYGRFVDAPASMSRITAPSAAADSLA